MTFLHFTSWHDIPYQMFLTQHKNSDSLAFDLYDDEHDAGANLLWLNDNTESIEQKNQLESFKNLQQARKFVEASGNQNRSDNTLAQLLEPVELAKILCPAEQDTNTCLNYLCSYQRWVNHSLHWAKTDFVTIVETLRENWTKQKKNHQDNDELQKAEILLKSFQKNKCDVERLLKVIRNALSSPNPGALSHLQGPFKMALYYVERDMLNITQFLNDLCKKNPFSMQNMVQDLSRTLPEGVISHLHLLHKTLDAAWDTRREAMFAKLVEVFKSQHKRHNVQDLQNFTQKLTAFKEAAPDIDRACKTVENRRNYVIALNPFYDLLKAKASTLVVEKETLAQQAYEELFKEEQLRLQVTKETSQEVVDVFHDEEEEFETPQQIATPSLPSKPVFRWQHLHTQMMASKTVEKWRTEQTTPEMAEASKLCMRHAAFHFSLLRAQIKLMIKAREANHLHLIPLFSLMLARSCSLLTEQLLTARLAMRNNAAKFTHYHLELATGMIPDKDHESWDLFKALDGGEIFHRYPHQFFQRCKELKLPVPSALQWILEPRACSYRELFQLAENTLNFIGKALPELSTRGLIEELAEKNQPSPLSDNFRNALSPVCRKLEACLNKTDQIIQRCGVREAKHWRDVRAQLQGFHLALSCLIEFPQAETLCALGDSLLAQAQYLDELIENGCFLRANGYLLDSHDLEAFRLLRNPPPDDAEQQLIADLNGEDGTHYPHRYIQNEGRVPKALKWRFDAAKFAVPGKDFDREAQEQESDRLSGFKQVKNGKMDDVRHPLFGLHEDLIRWIGGIAELSDRRLTTLMSSQ